jgi:transposase
VARAAGIHASQLYRWRRDLCERTGTTPSFAAVTVAPPAAAAAVEMIEIEFARGARVRITGDAVTLSATIVALLGGDRR